MRKLAAMSLICLAAFAGVARSEDTVRVGVYLPLTGQYASAGRLELEGVQLANKEVFKVLGKRVELVVADNKSDRIEAANAVKRLIDREKVSVIIGTSGSALAMAGGEVAERSGIPVVGTSCSHPLVTQGRRHTFRVCAIDSYQGAGAATYACRDLGLKTAAILLDAASDYSVGLAGYFTRSFEKQGGKVVARQSYRPGDQDFTTQLAEIIAKKPDVLFIPSEAVEGVFIIKQARELGATFRILGGDAMDNPMAVQVGGGAMEGFLYTTFLYDPSFKNGSRTAERFTQSWKRLHPDVEPGLNAALGYDAYMLVIDAIMRAGRLDPAAISQALANTRGFEGVTGSTSINAAHDAEKPVGLIEIKDGGKVFVGTVLPVM